MRISRASLVLLILAVAFFATFYFVGEKSRKYEIEKENENRANGGFYISDTPQEMNYWDISGLGFLVLGASSTIAAIWLRKK